jgi:hypothetical protein
MFRRFNRLMPLSERNKYEILYNTSKYNFTPNLPTLSLYSDIMSYLFKDSKNSIKYIHNSNIPYDEQWECRDFKKTDNKSIPISKIPYEEQWEVRDFYVRNKSVDKKNIDKYIEKKKKEENRGYDLVVLNDKTITYNDYIQQLFLLDKKNRCK